MRGILQNPPERISTSHILAEFDCGEPSLNEWLVRRALRNKAAGASRTYIVHVDSRVVGYYSLATGAVDRDEVPKSLQRNMPTPVPVMVLGRLAVDRRHQGQRLGQALLRDAILRTLKASEIAGIKAILVHAISDEARHFYLRQSFTESPVAPMTLCLALETVRQAIAE